MMIQHIIVVTDEGIHVARPLTELASALVNDVSEVQRAPIRCYWCSAASDIGRTWGHSDAMRVLKEWLSKRGGAV